MLQVLIETVIGIIEAVRVFVEVIRMLVESMRGQGQAVRELVECRGPESDHRGRARESLTGYRLRVLVETVRIGFHHPG
jgi:hypothetical protein